MTEEEKQIDSQFPEEHELIEEKSPQPGPRSRPLLILLGGGLILALVAVGFWLHYRDRVSTDDAQVDGHIVPISAKISGSVQQVMVDDNQHVKAGDVLVRIDPRDYQAKVDQEKAALALDESSARAAQVTVPLTRQTTESGTSGVSASIASAEAQALQAKLAAEQAATSDLSYAHSNLAAAKANNDKAQADLARMRPLVAKTEISQQQFDSYLAAAQVAEAQLKAAQDRVQSAEQSAATSHAASEAALARVAQARAQLVASKASERQVQVTTAQAASAVARVQEASANLEAAELNLSYTIIVSPVDGMVTKKSVEIGQIIQPGQALMALVPVRDVWVTANFKETQLAHVHPGQTAEVHVDMYGRTIQGRVDSIAEATGARLSLLPPENATGNFVKVVQRIPVKIVFDSLPPGVILRPGMNVDATILTK
jgi:membrane fusion protein, multidrug efflux system